MGIQNTANSVRDRELTTRRQSDERKQCRTGSAECFETRNNRGRFNVSTGECRSGFHYGYTENSGQPKYCRGRDFATAALQADLKFCLHLHTRISSYRPVPHQKLIMTTTALLTQNCSLGTARCFQARCEHWLLPYAGTDRRTARPFD